MDDAWELVEHCARYYTHEEPDGEILETQTLTILHWKKEPISFFGTIIGEQTATAGGTQVEFSAEPSVPFELSPEQEVLAEEVERQDAEGDPQGSCERAANER